MAVAVVGVDIVWRSECSTVARNYGQMETTEFGIPFVVARMVEDSEDEKRI